MTDRNVGRAEMTRIAGQVFEQLIVPRLVANASEIAGLRAELAERDRRGAERDERIASLEARLDELGPSTEARYPDALRFDAWLYGPTFEGAAKTEPVRQFHSEARRGKRKTLSRAKAEQYVRELGGDPANLPDADDLPPVEVPRRAA
jgi:hypothetical protein